MIFLITHMFLKILLETWGQISIEFMKFSPGGTLQLQGTHWREGICKSLKFQMFQGEEFPWAKPLNSSVGQIIPAHVLC